MANVYAVKTGNWSDVTVWNTGALPTSADDVYSNNFTVTIDQNVTVLSIRNEAQSPIVAGGGFILNNSITVTCTGIGIRNGASTSCITFSGTGTSYINANVTLNASSHCINITSTGTLYIVGNIIATFGNGFAAVNAQTTSSTCYITGNVRAGTGSGVRCIFAGSGATFYITGNVTIIAAGNANSAITILNANVRIFITGNVFYESDIFNSNIIVSNNNAACYLNIVGYISSETTSNSFNVAISSNNTQAINIMSGPFICASNGLLPFNFTRMHLIPTVSSYYEFRDNSTNGALPPAASAPATRLVSPGTAVDSPSPANVRNGVTYAFGTLTGTAYIPNSASVAYGVPVDNTTGVALLTGDSWIAAISSSNDPFAQRLRNLATVQTTAAQIAAF